jgi:hypothetical protein
MEDEYVATFSIDYNAVEFFVNAKKINAIKEFRSFTAFGLKDSKDVIEAVMQNINTWDVEGHRIVVRMSATMFAALMERVYNKMGDIPAGYFKLESVQKYTPEPRGRVTNITI